MKKLSILLLAASAVPSVCSASQFCIPEAYPTIYKLNGTPHSESVWEVDSDSAIHTGNGQPSVCYTDTFVTLDASIEVKVTTPPLYPKDNDDDFFGFTFGFEPNDTENSSANYLLIDWKKGTQAMDFQGDSYLDGNVAYAGLAVSKVLGTPMGDEFWGHSNLVHYVDNYTFNKAEVDNGLKVLQRGFKRGNTGWQNDTTYTFVFKFTEISMHIYVDGILDAIVPGDFAGARFGLYNFSQPDVVYSDLKVIADSEDEDEIEIEDETDPVIPPEVPMDLTRSSINIKGKKDSAKFNMVNVSGIKDAVDKAVANNSPLTFEFGLIDAPPLYTLPTDSCEIELSKNNMVCRSGKVNVIRCVFSTEKCVVNIQESIEDLETYASEFDANLPNEMVVTFKVGETTYTNTGEWKQIDSGKGPWTEGGSWTRYKNTK